jgi:hypothetical protein
MQLGVVEVKLDSLSKEAHGLERLCLEFEDQWGDTLPGLPKVNSLPTLISSVLNGVDDHFGWFIYPANPYPEPRQAQPREVPGGIILVSPRDPSNGAKEKIFDLFVWMRGAYRNTGLGRKAVQDVFKRIPEKAPYLLRVLLPVKKLTGPGGELQKSMWLTFFYHHEFEPTEKQEAEGEFLVLERAFNQRTP